MISKYNYEYVIKRWPEVDARKLKLVKVGVNFNRFLSPKIRQRRQRIRLLTVARLHPIKQLPFHLEICRKLRDKVEWRFIGDGTDRQYLEKLVKEYDLEDSVVLAGMVAHEDMAREYQKADIFVLLSKSEGLPTVLIEAMATSLPVVASRITGIPELVENEVNGYLVSSNNLDEAVKAITKLIELPELRMKMGELGKQKVLQEYAQEQNGIKMRDLFYQGK